MSIARENETRARKPMSLKLAAWTDGWPSCSTLGTSHTCGGGEKEGKYWGQVHCIIYITVCCSLVIFYRPWTWFCLAEECLCRHTPTSCSMHPELLFYTRYCLDIWCVGELVVLFYPWVPEQEKAESDTYLISKLVTTTQLEYFSS